MDQADRMAYGRTWYAATMVPAPPRPRLAADADVEVCVIGGGLAGLTATRELARRGWSVVLLEASRIAANASGRNTGFVLPGFAAEPASVIARVGFVRAKNLWALAEAGLDYVREAIAGDAMTAVEPQDGWLYVSKIDKGEEFMRLAGLLRELGCEAEGWPTERVRAALRSARYFHAVNFPRAIHIHPLNYALGLAAAAERDGARIFEHTPALSIDPAGVRKRIVTPAGRLRADHVVLCGNVQIGSLMPHLAAALIPITTYVIVTAPLGPRLAEAVGYGGAVSDSDLADNHYRVVGGDRLMWSGRATVWARNPRRYVRALAADIRRTYPQLGRVAVDYAWSGTLGNTIHRMPQIGELGPRVWLASGFGGHGLNTTAMAGNIIARAIIEGDRTWQQFTPFELVRAGGILGRAAAQMYYWIKRLGDGLAERRARSAERAQRDLRPAGSVADTEQELQQAEPEAEAHEATLPHEVTAPLSAPALDEPPATPAVGAELESQQVEPEAGVDEAVLPHEVAAAPTVPALDERPATPAADAEQEPQQAEPDAGVDEAALPLEATAPLPAPALDEPPATPAVGAELESQQVEPEAGVDEAVLPHEVAAAPAVPALDERPATPAADAEQEPQPVVPEAGAREAALPHEASAPLPAPAFEEPPTAPAAASVAADESLNSVLPSPAGTEATVQEPAPPPARPAPKRRQRRKRRQTSPSAPENAGASAPADTGSRKAE